MTWIVKASTWFAAFGFVSGLAMTLAFKLRRRDMPRVRGLALILLTAGLGQWSVICLGIAPHLAGEGVSLSRRLTYYSADADPMGAIVGAIFHILLGGFVIGFGLYFGLTLVRKASLASLSHRGN